MYDISKPLDNFEAYLSYLLACCKVRSGLSNSAAHVCVRVLDPVSRGRPAQLVMSEAGHRPSRLGLGPLTVKPALTTHRRPVEFYRTILYTRLDVYTAVPQLAVHTAHPIPNPNPNPNPNLDHSPSGRRPVIFSNEKLARKESAATTKSRRHVLKVMRPIMTTTPDRLAFHTKMTANGAGKMSQRFITVYMIVRRDKVLSMSFRSTI